MDIMVTGANGLLGQHLVSNLLLNGHRVHAVGRGVARVSAGINENFLYHSLDIRDKPSLSALFASIPAIDVLIHAAALTQVDYCELHQQEAYDVNVNGTTYLLEAADAACAHVVYVSTDFVFDGVRGNYREDDPVGPVNYYGETKWLAEQQIQHTNMLWSIARTCLVYGNPVLGTRSNIISWVKENLEQGKPINVVDDQVRTPTYVKDLADGIQRIAEKGAGGIFHLAGKDVLTPYAMACSTAAFFGLPGHLIERVDAAVFSQPARRPLQTGLAISKAGNVLGYAPHSFAEGMADMYS